MYLRHVRPTNTQINLRIRAVRPESVRSTHEEILQPCRNGYQNCAYSEDSDQMARIRRLIWIFSSAHVWRNMFWCWCSYMYVLKPMECICIFYKLDRKMSSPKHTFIHIKGSIFLQNRHFIIQGRFNKLIYGIDTIIQCGTWHPVKFQLISRSWNEIIVYDISELMLATLIQRYDFIFDPAQKRETNRNFTGFQMPHFMIVLIL